jgi:hypothetical protein
MKQAQAVLKLTPEEAERALKPTGKLKRAAGLTDSSSSIEE